MNTTQNRIAVDNTSINPVEILVVNGKQCASEC